MLAAVFALLLQLPTTIAGRRWGFCCFIFPTHTGLHWALSESSESFMAEPSQKRVEEKLNTAKWYHNSFQQACWVHALTCARLPSVPRNCLLETWFNFCVPLWLVLSVSNQNWCRQNHRASSCHASGDLAHLSKVWLNPHKSRQTVPLSSEPPEESNGYILVKNT